MSNLNREITDCCCTCDNRESSEKKVIVEYLYLDLETCKRCVGTDEVLEEVLKTLTPTLELAGYIIKYIKVEMMTAEIAIQYGFLSSPTIRVNGQDICQTVAETSCGCCSEISNTDVDCRVFEYNGETYEVPPKEMLAEAVLQSVFGHTESDCSYCSYELPDNLKDFFEGKQNKKCACEGNC
jgi:hypothetical protein